MGDFTALELVNKAAAQLTLSQTSSLANTDPQTVQFVEFLNVTGRRLSRKAEFSTYLESEFIIEFGAPTELTATTTQGSATVTVSSSAVLAAAPQAWAVTGDGIQIGCRVASVTDATTIVLTETVDVSQIGGTLTFTQDTFDLPADYLKDIPQTHWDRRFQWRMIGPDTPQVDQWLRSGIVAIGPRRRFRQIGRSNPKFRIYPPPSAASDYPGTLVFNYMSKDWVDKADGSTAAIVSADGDIPVFPDDQVLIQGIMWRYWRAKGLPYQDLRADFEDDADQMNAEDGGMQVLRTNRRGVNYLITPANVQDGNFPGN